MFQIMFASQPTLDKNAFNIEEANHDATVAAMTSP